MSKVKLSIIIVHYKVKKELFECIESINKAQAKIHYEIIVVDNDEKKTIEQELKKFFPKVEYVKALENNGFGAGNNVGAEHAKGEYLFILSPDTKIFPGTIEGLIDIFQKKKNAAIVAPLLLDKNGVPYPLQGSGELTPLRGVIALSLINKLLPNNSISNKYWLKTWDKKRILDVDVASGTAFVIRRDVFEKVGGFDKRFFLYFEESDLCRRVKKLGYKIYINPQSKLFHLWGASTKNIKTSAIFSRSRFLYFRKHYGFLAAVAVHIATSINIVNVLLAFILILASFLRFFRLSDLMMFIGDQGLFYLPARDMILYGNIPLVGPETSHPWIHHGPLWTYTLGIILMLFNFDPIAPAYFIAILGVLTIFVFYLTLESMFGKNIALLASMLYATAPLIVMNARVPYHTSPIPFFVILLFLFTYKWIKGNVWVFPIITFLLGVLYNQEITTFVFFVAIGIVVGFGFIRKEGYFKKLFDKKIIFTSTISFLIPMIPFIIYDIFHGYKQTFGFLIWVIYRVVKFPISLNDKNFVSSGSNPSTLAEFFSNYKQLIFAPSSIIAFMILLVTTIFIIRYLLQSKQFQKKIPSNFILLFLFLGVAIVGLSIHRFPIEADTLLISPFIIILTTLSILWVFKNNFKLALICVVIISSSNILFLILTNFLTNLSNGSRITFRERLEAVEKIISLSYTKPYNIMGKGGLSDFPSFTMPYEYLLWWKGHAPTKEDVALKIVVWEKEGEIVVYEQDIKNQKSKIKNAY